MKKKILYLSTIILTAGTLLLSSCSKENDVSPANANTTDKSEARVAGPAIVIPSDAYIFYGQGDCLGWCPSFTVEVFQNGLVVYNGITNVAVTGTIKYQVSPQLVEYVKNWMVANGFTQLANNYPYVVDAQQHVTAINSGDVQKTVVDYGFNVPSTVFQIRQVLINELQLEGLVAPVPPTGGNVPNQTIPGSVVN